MAYSSKASAPIALLLALNLIFSTLVSSSSPPPPPPPSTCIPILSSTACIALLGVLNVDASISIGSNPSNLCCTSILGLIGVSADACICPLLTTVRALLYPAVPLANIDVVVGRFNSFCNSKISACI
ncbi:hypothetical protein CCACVL1_11561 [Corchorus capsularis]|uniref:Bifunctional inhibitor/plant lipid transfer protein/seed storage helical domain-containing protein n=1 Tax=Corchorus capsularis TaxID=210143 RepID=A0A1R3IKN3_COCAP|nr:hypothetical protein CCACVL1_11561 [Corchorus capsularis]